MDFQTFHKYNRLVRRGLTKPLSCPRCGTEYVLRCTEQGDPVLQCFMCNSKTQPGHTLWTNIKAVVEEHMPSGGTSHGPI